MAFAASASGICARALGAVIAVVLFAAAPIIPGSLAPAQAQARASVSIEFRTALEPYGRWERHGRRYAWRDGRWETPARRLR